MKLGLVLGYSGAELACRSTVSSSLEGLGYDSVWRRGKGHR